MASGRAAAPSTQLHAERPRKPRRRHINSSICSAHCLGANIKLAEVERSPKRSSIPGPGRYPRTLPIRTADSPALGRGDPAGTLCATRTGPGPGSSRSPGCAVSPAELLRQRRPARGLLPVPPQPPRPWAFPTDPSPFIKL